MVESLRRRAGQFGLEVILVNIWEGVGAPEEAAGYCMRWGIEGKVLLDEDTSYAREVGIRGVPTNVFVDASGVVQAVGATTSEELFEEACRLEPELRKLRAELLGSDRTPSGFVPEELSDDGCARD